MTQKPVRDDEWTTVTEGSRTRLTFDEVGDVFTGFYEGAETIENPETGEDMHYLNFRADGGNTGMDIREGESCAISRGYALDRAMQDVPVGVLTRIELVKIVPSRRGNDFKDYKVQYKA